jgi:secreted trypsin-like serine protease
MRRIVLALVAVLALLASVAPAHAIVNGQPDGNRHPNVGALVYTTSKGEKDWLCSGTLISPTVFLTAAHCYIGQDRMYVTFDSEFSPTGTFYAGTMYTHPNYPGNSADSFDIAVVVLDQAVTGITPAKLPTAGLFDQLAAKNGLKNQKFTIVGYGGAFEGTKTGQVTIEYDGVRRYATGSFNALNNTWIRISQNGATGDSGACYGDSGGPNFLGTTDIVASTTITGDVPCRATNVTYRLDTPSARDFLGQFVTLP